MKNNTNIYDIDDELVRKAGDNHQFTVDELQEKIDKYAKKLKDLNENDPTNPKIAVYTTYIKNLQGAIFNIYSTMPLNKLKELVAEKEKEENLKEQVNTAINELKKEIENEDTAADQPKNQDDFLVDGEGRSETVMNQYVDFEEVQ